MKKITRRRKPQTHANRSSTSASVIKLLLGANIPAPSRYGMQNCVTQVGELIKKWNTEDMHARRPQLKAISKWRNRPEDQVDVEADGMYNNNLYSGVEKTPFQAGTQCTYTVAENVTPKKQIIAVETINKLCSKHGCHASPDGECDIKTGVVLQLQ